MILTCVASARSRKPVTRPSCITMMRSLMPSTSGISDEIMITATPCPASCDDEPVDLRLGADIDAARRLVEDEDLRIGQQPAADQHLLLVAAGKVLDPLLHVRRLDPQRLAHLGRMLQSCPSPATNPYLTKLVLQHRDLHVLQDVENQQAAGLLAVLGEEGHAVADGLRRRSRS